MDTELFELCKEVYGRTNWRHLTLTPILEGVEEDHDLVGYIYDSDYLLEKLPVSQGRKNLTLYAGLDSLWYAGYMGEGDFTLDLKASNPLKALLKLTIALVDAGELK